MNFGKYSNIIMREVSFMKNSLCIISSFIVELKRTQGTGVKVITENPKSRQLNVHSVVIDQKIKPEWTSNEMVISKKIKPINLRKVGQHYLKLLWHQSVLCYSFWSQTRIRIYENHSHKTEWNEHNRFIDASKELRKGKKHE